MISNPAPCHRFRLQWRLSLSCCQGFLHVILTLLELMTLIELTFNLNLHLAEVICVSHSKKKSLIHAPQPPLIFLVPLLCCFTPARIHNNLYLSTGNLANNRLIVGWYCCSCVTSCSFGGYTDTRNRSNHFFHSPGKCCCCGFGINNGYYCFSCCSPS